MPLIGNLVGGPKYKPQWAIDSDKRTMERAMKQGYQPEGNGKPPLPKTGSGIKVKDQQNFAGAVVYVVMGNDYPDRVFAKGADADEYVNTKTAVEKEKQRQGIGSRIYWRHYEFEVR